MEGLGVWYEDFWSLSTDRQIGLGAGPIPQSAIDRHVAGWGYEDVEMFEYCIREMDRAYLMKANSSEPEVAPGPPPRFADLAKGR